MKKILIAVSAFAFLAAFRARLAPRAMRPTRDQDGDEGRRQEDEDHQEGREGRRRHRLDRDQDRDDEDRRSKRSLRTSRRPLVAVAARGFLFYALGRMKIRTKLILLLSTALIVTMLVSTWLRIAGRSGGSRSS